MVKPNQRMDNLFEEQHKRPQENFQEVMITEDELFKKRTSSGGGGM